MPLNRSGPERVPWVPRRRPPARWRPSCGRGLTATGWRRWTETLRTASPCPCSPSDTARKRARGCASRKRYDKSGRCVTWPVRVKSGSRSCSRAKSVSAPMTAKWSSVRVVTSPNLAGKCTRCGTPATNPAASSRSSPPADSRTTSASSVSFSASTRMTRSARSCTSGYRTAGGPWRPRSGHGSVSGARSPSCTDDVGRLRAALDDGSAAMAVGQAEWVARHHGVHGTPAWLVEGQLIVGLQPLGTSYASANRPRASAAEKGAGQEPIWPSRCGFGNLSFTNAGWSSSVARWAHNPEVAGSNPVPATSVVSRDIVDGCPETWFTPLACFRGCFRF